MEAGVYHSQGDPSYSLCKGALETIQQHIARCNVQAEMVYTETDSVQENVWNMWIRSLQLLMGDDTEGGWGHQR